MQKRLLITKTTYSLLFISMVLCTCMPEEKPVSQGDIALHIPVVHPKFREFPYPSAEITPAFNPPVLRWPRAKGQHAQYAVRLSMDSTFQADDLIQAENLPWAMLNPHRVLPEGKWYWQYKASGENWSPLQTFMINDEVKELSAPPAETFLAALPSGHPRVLAEKSQVVQLQQRIHDEDARAIVAEAVVFLQQNPPQESMGIPKIQGKDKEQERKLRLDASVRLGNLAYKAVSSMAQAYLLTGDEQYARQAIRWALEVAAWNPKGVSHTNDFGDSRCMLSMALVYDTFYEQLSEEQKVLLRNSIRIRASYFYEEWVNFIESKLLSNHVWQHTFHYFFQTALAMYGELEEAGAWLTYAYELWLARAPILGGSDGGWVNGANYFIMNMETLMEVPYFIKKYTGFDFINQHSWYVQHIRWMIYHVPPGSSADGFGDNSEDILFPGADYVAFAREIGKLTNRSEAIWYADKCLEYHPADLSQEKNLRWFRLVRTHDLKLPAPPQNTAFPLAQCFRDVGVVAMHTDLAHTENDLMVAMRSSPYGSYGHMLADQNTFNILYGGNRLFYHSGYKISMQDPHRLEWYKHTKSHNGILVNGQGQPYSVEAFGWLPRFLQGDRLAYAAGDASHAYESDETGEDVGVRKFRRHLLLLKPDIIVIYDELEAEQAAGWSWVVHSPQSIRLDTAQSLLSAQLPAAFGQVKLWGSVPLEWQITNKFEVPAINWREQKNAEGELKGYEDTDWHVTATTRTKTQQMRFLAVFQVAQDEVKALSGEVMEGKIQVQAADWNIEATLAPDKVPLLEITESEGMLAFTTHGDDVTLQGKSYEGSIEGSAKMAEVVNGEVRFSEAGDVVPEAMQQALLLRLQTYPKQSVSAIR